MKRTNKRAFIFATTLSLLLFAATGASARGMHDVITDSNDAQDMQDTKVSNYWSESKAASDTMRSADPSAARLKNFSGKGRKFIAHKRRKSSKHRKSKDRTTSHSTLIEPKSV